MEKTVTVPKKKGKIRQFIPLYLMALPGLLYLLINNYLPMAGLTIAFRNVNYTKGIWKSDWCGLANFKYLFATKDAWVITRNTIGYNLLFIVLQTVMAIAIALFLNEVKSKFWNRFFQTSVLLPYLFSYVIASYLVYAFLSPTTGMFNHIVTVIGKDPVSWYMESVWITVGRDGILSFEWDAPSTEPVVKETQTALMPFEDIASIANTMLPVVVIGPSEARSLVEIDKINGDETYMDVEITKVSLSLMRIRDKGSFRGRSFPCGISGERGTGISPETTPRSP